MTDFLIRHCVKNYRDVKDMNVRSSYGTLGALGGIVVNVTLSLVKFILGFVTGSLAVTADAVNNISDAAGSIMTLATVRISAKPVDRDHPFGHGRMEYIGSLAVGGLILVAGAQLLRDGIESVIHPASVSVSLLVFALLVLSILAKLWLFLFYRRIAGAISSDALSAASKDSLSDVLATSAVFLSMVIQYLTSWNVDGIFALLVSLFVLKAGYGVCRETVDKLLGTMPDPAFVRTIRTRMLSYPGIIGIHDLVVHDYGPGRCIVTVHAEVDARENIVAIHEVIDRVERDLQKELSIMMCVHMDPIVTDDPKLTAIKDSMSGFLRSVDSRLSLHDFRMVPGEKQINVIFDCLLPNDSRIDQYKLRDRIQEYARTLDERYNVVVRFDSEFCDLDDGV